MPLDECVRSEEGKYSGESSLVKLYLYFPLWIGILKITG